jgi:imidazole glycerol-phosphate synthase subunit HisH
MVGIVNYGSGNVYAIANLHKMSDINYIVSEKPRDLEKASHLILPGVGAFDSTMNTLNSSGLSDYLNEEVLIHKKPILGVCVGMQILGNGSEEGNLSGFGWIEGFVKKLPTTELHQKPHIPHLGWNSIKPTSNDLGILSDINLDLGFYFLHSYYFSPTNIEDIMSYTSYGLTFASSINKNNVFGVQFHPEKSHQNGIKLFQNFSKLKC